MLLVLLILSSLSQPSQLGLGSALSSPHHSSFHAEPHLLKITFHVVNSVHNPLLIVMVGDQLDCEKMFTAPDEHLEHLLVLAGVLLRDVERVTEFFGNHIEDVGVI